MSIGDAALEARLARSLLTGVRVLALLTEEEPRALAVAEAVAERLGWPLHTWSVAAGVDRSGRERELGAVLARVREAADEAVWLLFDAGAELRSSAQRRLLRELAQTRDGPAMILVERGPAEVPDVPELEIERLELPDAALLGERLRWIAGELDDERPELAASLRGAELRLAEAGVGLELERFDRVLATAALAESSAPTGIARLLAAARAPEVPGLARVEPAAAGELLGFDRYLEWLSRQALSFDPAARAAGVSPARAVALVGCPGCGKGLAARVSASVLELDLVRLDSARLEPGASPSVFAALERAAPIAVWIAELDRADAIAEPLIAWLATRERPVFAIITSSRPDRLPRRLWTGGRVDAPFFVDLPGPELRARILTRLLGPDCPEGAAELARATDNLSGADLAAALTQARLLAFAAGRRPGVEDLERALAERIPTARREAKLIERVRDWARERARPVE